MGIIDDNGRELAETKLAALRTQMNTAGEAGAVLSREAKSIARELGVTLREKEGAPNPDSVLGRLASLRLARYRSHIEKVSAEEERLESRRVMLESALVEVVRLIQIEGNRIVAAQIAHAKAVAIHARTFPSPGADMFSVEVLQPVP